MKLWWSIDTVISKISKYLIWVSVACLVYMTFSATADAITTKFFDLPIPGTSELIEDLNIPLVLLGMAYCQLTTGHLAGPVFERKFSPAVNKGIRMVSHVIGMFVCGLIGWRAIPLFQEMFLTQQAKNATLEYVLWPFSLALLISFVLVTVAFFLSLIRDIAGVEIKAESDEELTGV